MNLLEAEKLAKELMAKHLPRNGKFNWYFKWSHAKQTFGVCSSNRRTMIGHIKLSKPLTELNDVTRVTNTILHEIAHAMDTEIRGHSNHDWHWVKVAKSIGCDGERCYRGEDVEQPQSKYTLSCGTCGKEAPKHRKPKRSGVACGKCCKTHNNGKYSDKYKMELIQNY